ncbi:hypothetical protein BVX97_01470 [bacterium E08(2017)]|nr:hypothetical protein BVX97_01470 [bacterium E08(2017)]
MPLLGSPCLHGEYGLKPYEQPLDSPQQMQAKQCPVLIIRAPQFQQDGESVSTGMAHFLSRVCRLTFSMIF